MKTLLPQSPSLTSPLVSSSGHLALKTPAQPQPPCCIITVIVFVVLAPPSGSPRLAPRRSPLLCSQPRCLPLKRPACPQNNSSTTLDWPLVQCPVPRTTRFTCPMKATLPTAHLYSPPCPYLPFIAFYGYSPFSYFSIFHFPFFHFPFSMSPHCQPLGTLIASR